MAVYPQYLILHILLEKNGQDKSQG